MNNLSQADLRFAKYYLAQLRKAGKLYDQGGEVLQEGLRLLNVEWSNLEAAQSRVESHADTDEAAEICSSFPEAAPRLLDLRQHPRDRIRWLEAALGAARRLHDRLAEGRHLNNLALAYSRSGKLIKAIELFKESLEIFQLASDNRSVAEVLANMGYAYASMGEATLAITVSEKAMTVAQELKDRRSEGIALSNLGQSFYLMREFRRAIEFYERSLEIMREIGYSAAENVVLNNLGKTWAILNKPKQAIVFYEQALGIARMIDDREGQMKALGNLGQAYYFLNDVDRAIETYKAGLLMAKEIGGDPLIEAEFLNNLGDAYLDAGEPQQAQACYEQRVKITREFGRRRAANAEQLFHDWSLQMAVNVSDEKTAVNSSVETSEGVCWLHLSDFHFGGSASNRYDEEVVVESLLKDIGERIEKDGLAPDFIVITGDLAFSGKSPEYELAREFLDELLKITEVTRPRLFIVPGNHDVDRSLISRGALELGKTVNDKQVTNDILGSPDDRRLLFSRFKGYSEFFNDYFKGHNSFDDERYFYVAHFNMGSRRLAILGLNSSWLAASNEDETFKLVIGERQTRVALKAADKASPALKIALLHHPHDWIRSFDQSYSMSRLLTECHFVLHGHLHKSSATHFSNPDGSALVIAGGACYETRDYPNSYNFVKLNFGSNTGQIYLRKYTDKGEFWVKDVELYKNAPDGVIDFSLARTGPFSG
jgi:tetratricopeptide (TPR) repeat protein